MKTRAIHFLISFSICLGLATAMSPSFAQTMADFNSLPPTLGEAADPNVMLDLSVETPMQGAAYNDQADAVTGCLGREDSTSGGSNDQLTGVCYDPATTYLGYFDSNKCYDYDSSDGRFEPDSMAGANHTCSGEYSGNFMNWATMSAIDIFRQALTGGHRQTDTASETVLERTTLDASRSYGHSWFPLKKIDINHPTFPVDPATVTPYNENVLWVVSHDTRVDFERTKNAKDLDSDLNVRVEVCDTSEGLETNCKAYGGGANYKPEGLMQANAHRMRFAVMSYVNDTNLGTHGGILRSNMKYVGPTMLDTSGALVTNPNTEWDATTGVFTFNPNPADATASGVSNSGVINYLNGFGANGYKSYDPVGELFYECLNYFKNRGPTTDFSSGLTAAQKDGFPAILTWDDPIVHDCQKNFIVAINDANPWDDKRVPGTAVTSQFQAGLSPPLGWDGPAQDWGEPSGPDLDIDATALTNTVGDLQGITGTQQLIGCVPGDCDGNNNLKTINELGKAFGTPPYVPKENSYYVAGLSYYANSHDIRNDINGRQSVKTFMVDTQEYNATPLVGQMNMLWLTGKYGGFNEIDFLDTNSDGNEYEPNLAAEWDADGDGEPDQYVLAGKPEQLVNGLQKAFLSIDTRASAGSAAAVVANSGSGVGQVVQALYQPTVNNEDTGEQIRWSGIIHSVFIDDASFLREDTNENDQLDDYATDKVIQVFFDASVERARVRRWDYSDFDDPSPTAIDVVELSSTMSLESGQPTVKTIWNGRDELNALDGSSIATQRGYTSLISGAGAARHIITGMDIDFDGIIDASESMDFTAANVDATNYGYFDVASDLIAKDIVDFIRGVEGITGFRNRTIDYDGDSTSDEWLLGDMVHSTPVVVGSPKNSYDITYGDITYEAFKQQYANRRQMVYVGGNDGLLHAFNGGFWDDANSGFVSQLSGEVAHPLGSELWAYAPGNLLPHMQWLADANYSHVYYVDGPPVVFDANIFAADSDHPDGWGTVLAIGMRLGGGEMQLDTDNDSIDDFQSRSAYILMDVTNPEVAPKLIAEITHPEMGFTLGKPAVVKERIPNASFDWAGINSTGTNEWYLAFGSGPTELADITSTQNARMFLFDMRAIQFVTGYGDTNGQDTGLANSFVGDIGVADWNTDFVDDGVYFGTVGGTLAAPTGTIRRIKMADKSINELLDPGQPFVSAPATTKDKLGTFWVHAGTGRFYIQEDSDSVSTQTFYGFIEPVDVNGDPTYASVNKANMENVTDVQVFLNGDIADPSNSLSAAIDPATDDFNVLQAHIRDNTDGWYFDFEADGISGSTRNVKAATTVSNLLILTDYEPSDDICSPEGFSGLYVLDYTTGTAGIHGPLGQDGGDPLAFNNTRVDLGKGLASEPSVHQGAKRPGVVSIITQQTTAAITQNDATLAPVTGGRESWRELEIE